MSLHVLVSDTGPTEMMRNMLSAYYFCPPIRLRSILIPAERMS